MKKPYLLVFSLAIVLFSFKPQTNESSKERTSDGTGLCGTYSIPGDYETISEAIGDLNLNGISCSVIFNVAAGHTEIAANLTLSASGTSSNTITFQKSGSGANPKITASAGNSTTDGIIKLNGADYITFDGIDLLESAANTNATTQMEWGYALLKTDGTNGSQHNTIQNCSIMLNKANVNTIGIYSANHNTMNTTSLTVTSENGTNSYNKFYSNNITNVYVGYTLKGFLASSPYTFYDQDNEINRQPSSGSPSTVTNYGGGAATAYGVYAIYQNGIVVANTRINSSGGTNSTATLYGIFLSVGINSNADIFGDTVTVVSGSTASSLNAISNNMGASGTNNTVNIHDNVIQNCTYTGATGGSCTYINQQGDCFNLNIYNNQIINNSVGGTSTATGTINGINTSGGGQGTWQIYGNLIENITRTQTSPGLGLTYFINNSGSGSTFNVYDNIIRNCSVPNTSSIVAGFNFTGSCTVFSFHDNTFTNISIPGTSSSGATYGLFSPGASISSTIYNNSINNITRGGPSLMYGIHNSASTAKDIYQNTVYDLNSNGGNVFGIYQGGGTTVNISRNNINGLYTATSISPSVYGIQVNGGATVNITNNFISDLRNTASTGLNNVCGLYLSAGTNVNAFYNTIYFNAFNSSATSFGSSGIYANTAINLDLRNNIVVNASNPGPTSGLTVAYRRISAALSSYSSNSNNNCFFAGTPAANRLIFYDGTNSDQTLTAYKSRVSPRDNSSISENPPFINVGTAPFDLHINTSTPTLLECGAIVVSAPMGITTDYDGNSRYPNAGYPVGGITPSAPDIGADEFGGVNVDNVPPSISYTQLENGIVELSRNFTGVTIADLISGINTNSGSRPRCYYKKITDANNYFDNSSATEGWKYVEANGTTSPFDFTIDYSLLYGGGGVVLYDTIQYFVIGQDLAAVPNTGWHQATFASDPANVSISSTNCPITDSYYFEVGLPLPVNLIEFKASVKTRDVNITWTTGGEVNNSGFDLERRKKVSSGYSAWQKAAFIRGSGTTNSTVVYNYNDSKLTTGTYQYRLKQVDLNGNYEYFTLMEPSEVVISKPLSLDISQNYPNPSNPKSKIDFQMPFDGRVSIRVYDVLGQEVAVLIDGLKQADFYTVEFDGTNLASGIYFYRIIAEAGSQKFAKTMKMVIIK